jgi:hypothetical protein
MASTTAEVLLYFGNDDREFAKAVDYIRFSEEPELSTQEIIKILEDD